MKTSQEIQTKMEEIATITPGKKHTLKGKTEREIRRILSGISVEPTFFLAQTVFVMYQLVNNQMYIEKACKVELRYNETICDAMSQGNSFGSPQEEDVQELVAEILPYRTLLQTLLPTVLLPFVGSWSDRHNRRRPLILAPLLGTILALILLLIVNVRYFYETSLMVSVLAEMLPIALFGGWNCIYVGVYSFIGATTKDEEKTFRIGLIISAQAASSIIGSAVCGYIVQYIGYVGFYTLCIIMLIVAFILAIWLMKDDHQRKKDQGFSPTDFFNIKNLLNTVRVCFRKGPNQRRQKVALIFLVIVFIVASMKGEMTLDFLFTRLRYGWSVIEFGTYVSFSSLYKTFGAMASVILFSKFLKFDDSICGAICLAGPILTSIIHAFAETDTIYYVGELFILFHSGAHIITRSLLAKIVPPNELCQVNSVFGILDTLIPLVAVPVFSVIYVNTLKIFPGTYFLIIACFDVAAVLAFLCLYRLTKKNKKIDETVDSEAA